MYLHVLPFQLSLDGGRTTVSGTILMSPGLTTVSFTLTDLDDGVIILGEVTIDDSFIGPIINVEAFVEIEGLGEADIDFQIADIIFGTNMVGTVDADFEPVDLIDWLCNEPEDGHLRDRLLEYLPLISQFFSHISGEDLDGEGDDDLDEDWDLGAFEDFEDDLDDDEEDPPLNTMGLDQPYTGGRSSWLDAMDLDGYGGFSIQPDPNVFFEDADGGIYFLDGLTWRSVDDLVGGHSPGQSGIADDWRDGHDIIWGGGFFEEEAPTLDPRFDQFTDWDLDPPAAPPRVVARDYIGPTAGRETVDDIVAEVLAKPGPISDLPVEVIVAQVLAGNVDGRGGSTQL